MTTIIGLDLGKFISAACTFLTGDGEVRFQALPTKISALRQLFEQERPDLVVFEACAQAGFTADLFRELGMKYLVANTNGEAWKWKNVKRKTDRDDALKLARLAYLGELPTVELPETATRPREPFGYEFAVNEPLANRDVGRDPAVAVHVTFDEAHISAEHLDGQGLLGSRAELLLRFRGVDAV
jgi:hypothetical protein